MLIHICSIEFTDAKYTPGAEIEFDKEPFIVIPAEGCVDGPDLRQYIRATFSHQMLNPEKSTANEYACWKSYRTTEIWKPGQGAQLFHNHYMRMRYEESIGWESDYIRFSALFPDVNLLTADTEITTAATQAYFDAMYLKGVGGSYDGRFSNCPPEREHVINALMAFKAQGTIEIPCDRTIDWLERHGYIVRIVIGESKPFAMTVHGNRLLDAFVKLETGECK